MPHSFVTMFSLGTGTDQPQSDHKHYKEDLRIRNPGSMSNVELEVFSFVSSSGRKNTTEMYFKILKQ